MGKNCQKIIYTPFICFILGDGSGNESSSDGPSTVAKKKSMPVVNLRQISKISGSPKKRRRWTADEENLLFKGVLKFGVGHWAQILQYTRLKRTNVDIKDKWRNILSKGQEKVISKRLGIPLDVDSE